jgi:hypothetical protein
MMHDLQGLPHQIYEVAGKEFHTDADGRIYAALHKGGGEVNLLDGNTRASLINAGMVIAPPQPNGVDHATEEDLEQEDDDGEESHQSQAAQAAGAKEPEDADEDEEGEEE